ncbi:hypothetical protein ACQ4M4_06710 [Leptolyngbya sp. AN02str]|uniref:hypothetical protein n=1 Tax=Leptolyngbya sp. AN02str TaxID=3423363 RepID=UPI003D322FFF
MNTPAHVVLNLLCLGRRDLASVLTPVIVGAVLPDAPMFIFYGYERIIRGMSESWIWREGYYQVHWQNFIDLFNSIPLMLLGLGIAIWGRSQFGILLFTSMLLHIAGDLPLHHDDGHRHFFPFSDWRFVSPISYWDPKHYGNIVSIVEILSVAMTSAILFQNYHSAAGKFIIGIIGALYSLYFFYVVTVWM